jgi:peptide/nickel transport system permease protein
MLPPDERQQVRAEFGLDRPLSEQYLFYLRNLLRGELGRSFARRRPVIEILGERMPNTLILAAVGFGLTYLLAIVLSVVMIANINTWIDSTLTAICLLLRSPPVFWIGSMLITFLAFRLRWFPIGNMRTAGYPETGWLGMYCNWDFAWHLALPVFAVVIYELSFPLLLLRNAMMRHLMSDHVRTARAKGLRESTILARHVLRNSLLPLIASASISIGLSLGGFAVLEFVFSWPGLGLTIVEGISSRDYPVVQGAFLLMGVLVVLVSLVADLLYAALDPRITYR